MTTYPIWWKPKDLPEVGEEMTVQDDPRFVDEMTKGDLDLRMCQDGFKEKIEGMIKGKMKGEVAQLEEKPKS